MKRSDEDRLLRGLLADETVDALRETTLARGLAALHARRRRRALLSSVVASTAIAALLALLSTMHRPNAPVPRSASTATSHLADVTVISDEQLLALFPDRAVALIGAPGSQKLLFLDSPSTTRGSK